MNSRIFVTLGSLTLLTTAAAFAQSGASMQADIPFEFHVGTTVLPPGRYELRPQSGLDLVSIRCHECRAGAVILTFGVDARKTPEKGTLVFNRYENTYFLSRIWTAGTSRGRELHATKTERKFARDRVVSPVEVALAKR